MSDETVQDIKDPLENFPQKSICRLLKKVGTQSLPVNELPGKIKPYHVSDMLQRTITIIERSIALSADVGGGDFQHLPSCRLVLH